MSGKTQAEHKESAHPPTADMTADIDFEEPIVDKREFRKRT